MATLMLVIKVAAVIAGHAIYHFYSNNLYSNDRLIHKEQNTLFL